MGFTPKQIDEMSVWQYLACCEGFQGKSEQPDLDDAFDAVDHMGLEGL